MISTSYPNFGTLKKHQGAYRVQVKPRTLKRSGAFFYGSPAQQDVVDVHQSPMTVSCFYLPSNENIYLILWVSVSHLPVIISNLPLTHLRQGCTKEPKEAATPAKESTAS